MRIPPKNIRLHIDDVMDERHLAYYIRVASVETWVPKSQVTIGMVPPNHWYGIDIPKWLALQHGLVTPPHKSVWVTAMSEWKNDKDHSPDHLYFIQMGHFIKIGRSKDPVKRLGELSTGAPEAMYLIHQCPNKGHLEKKFHAIFKSFKNKGEWFKYDKQVEKFLKALVAEEKRRELKEIGEIV